MEPLKILSPIHKAKRQIEIHLEAECRKVGVSTVEGHLMSFLLSYSPCVLSELNRVFGLKPSTLTSLLDRLENRKLISRRINPTDRRSWIIEIRAEGERVARRLRSMVDRFEDSVIEGVSPAEMEGFIRVMDSIARVTAVEVRKKK